MLVIQGTYFLSDCEQSAENVAVDMDWRQLASFIVGSQLEDPGACRVLFKQAASPPQQELG